MELLELASGLDTVTHGLYAKCQITDKLIVSFVMFRKVNLIVWICLLSFCLLVCLLSFGFVICGSAFNFAGLEITVTGLPTSSNDCFNWFCGLLALQPPAARHAAMNLN